MAPLKATTPAAVKKQPAIPETSYRDAASLWATIVLNSGSTAVKPRRYAVDSRPSIDSHRITV
jgi:hypothetical protein